MLAEVLAVLDRQKIESGQATADEQFDNLPEAVTRSGFTAEQVDRGRVAMVRDYIYWYNTISRITHSHTYFALVPEGTTLSPGNIVEVEVRDQLPEPVRRIRARALDEGDCYYAQLDSGALREVMGAVSLVGSGGTASL